MDDGVQFARAMRMKKSGDSPYRDSDVTPHTNYPAYIDSLTTHQLDDPDLSGSPQVRQLLNANDSLRDSIQQDPNVETQTPLDILIPKMASGTATPDEAAHFRKLIGTKLGTNL